MPSTLYVHRKGETLTPIREKDRLELLNLPEGKPLRAKLTKPRNPKVHRLYFAAIAAAAKHWPEGEEPNPQGDEILLRQFLQCKAGWCIRIDFDVTQTDSVIRLLEETRDQEKYGFVKPIMKDGEPALGVYISKSVAYDVADDDLFNPVKTEVLAMIESFCSCTIQDLIEADQNEA